jgi:hypothetical protein
MAKNFGVHYYGRNRVKKGIGIWKAQILCRLPTTLTHKPLDHTQHQSNGEAVMNYLTYRPKNAHEIMDTSKPEHANSLTQQLGDSANF